MGGVHSIITAYLVAANSDRVITLAREDVADVITALTIADKGFLFYLSSIALTEAAAKGRPYAIAAALLGEVQGLVGLRQQRQHIEGRVLRDHSDSALSDDCHEDGCASPRRVVISS